MGEFERIISDIKSVRIQGAENIAKAGIRAFLLRQDEQAVKEIVNARPTEPLLQNSIKFLKKSKDYKKAAKLILKEIDKSHKLMTKFGAKLIRDDMNIYSHCHSSSVIDILVYAKKKQKKKFVVYTSEVEPLLQGRKTAIDLSKNGIKVIVFPDLAIENAIRKCDLFLFGADAFIKKGVVNKIGTSVLCQLAKNNKIKSYSCGISMKYSKNIKIEKRSSKEVWDERSKLIEVKNPAFDLTYWKFVTGVICEFGIVEPKKFINLSKEKLRELLNIKNLPKN